MRRRQSRYGVWWLSLASPAEPARSLAEAIGARVIVRSGASELLTDLERRLTIYARHESGNDPGTIHDETLALLRRRDDIGLDEFLRHEAYAFEATVEQVRADHIQHGFDDPTIRAAWGRLGPAANRRLASLIPLGMYVHDRLAEQLRSHANWASRMQSVSGVVAWQETWRPAFWTIGMALGALLIRLERYPALPAILATTWTNLYGSVEPFVGHPGEATHYVATTLGPTPPENRSWTFPAWTWLASDLRARDWLADRYPEWLRRDGEPEASMAEFDLLSCIAQGLRGELGVLALWSLNGAAADRYARRLHDDAQLRQRVSEAVGLDLEEFDRRAADILAGAGGVGPFPHITPTAQILRTGSFR